MLRVGRIDAIRASIFPVISISFFHAAYTHPVNELFSPTSKITTIFLSSHFARPNLGSRFFVKFHARVFLCVRLFSIDRRNSVGSYRGRGSLFEGSRFVLLTDFDSGGGIVRMKRCGQKTSRETKDRKLKVGARRS